MATSLSETAPAGVGRRHRAGTHQECGSQTRGDPVRDLPAHGGHQQLDIFREACAEAGRSITEKDILLARHVYVAESQKEAEKLCKRHFEYYFQNLLGEINNAAINKLLEQNPELTRDQVKPPYPFDVTPMEKMRDDGFVLVGTPDRVLSDLKAQYEELGGFGTFMAIVRMGAMPQELVLNNVRMFGKEVIPKLHAMGNGA